MSELKVYHCNERHNEYTEFYIKSDVDAAIDELKAENRRLKRALWLARALRARDKAFEYHFKNNVEMCAKWDNVHLMLMAKAEEYK